jgi:hypothetical protein
MSDNDTTHMPTRPVLVVLVLALIALGGVLAWHVNRTTRPITPTREVEGKVQQVSFVIRSAGKSRNGRLLFLNDQRDYRAQGVVTVVIDTEAVPEYAGVEPRSLVGKTVEAVGIVGDYKGRPQIMVRDAVKLTVR